MYNVAEFHLYSSYSFSLTEISLSKILPQIENLHKHFHKN